MQVEFTGRQTEVPEGIRELARRRLAKLAKVLGTVTTAHVTLTGEKHRQIVEVSVHSPRLSLAAEEESTDFTLSLSRVMDRLTRQAQRRVGKLRERVRRAPARATALWSGVLGEEAPPVVGLPQPVPEPPEPGPHVVRSRRLIVRTLSLAQAAGEVERSDEGVLVFREHRTQRVNVLYRRRDGNLGLIEPEV